MKYKFAEDEAVLSFGMKEDPAFFKMLIEIAKKQDIESIMLTAAVCLNTIFAIKTKEISFNAAGAFLLVEDGIASLILKEKVDIGEKPDIDISDFDDTIPYPDFLRKFVVLFQRMKNEEESAEGNYPEEDMDTDENQSKKEIHMVYYLIRNLSELYSINNIKGSLYKKGKMFLLHTEENHVLDEFFDRYYDSKPMDLLLNDISLIAGGK